MENSDDSLPYIDDIPTEEETNPRQYNLRIIENYQNRNRNIEITNRTNETANSLNSVAPLADETEFSDSLEETGCKHVRKIASKDSGMKLVIKGWNSSISIQGLDNKSSITFKRRCEKAHKRMERSEGEKSKPVVEEAKSVEKSRKGRWKMLTRSIMLAKSARFERRGLDERYPKYVLLKNEEEEEVKSVKENYPKMLVFNDKSTKQKPEFSFKKSFKNKTEPIALLDEILEKTDVNDVKKQKKPLTERNLKIKKKVLVERRKSVTAGKIPGAPPQPETNPPGRPLPHTQVYKEIQDVLEDALKLLPPEPDAQHPEIVQQPQRLDYYTSVPPQLGQLFCHDPYCCLTPHPQPPKYVPVYAPHKGHIYNNSNAQTKYSYPQDPTGEKQNPSEGDVNLENLPFGILSSFFPRVVIMNSISNEDVRREEEEEEVSTAANEPEFTNFQPPKMEVVEKFDEGAKETLEVPQQDLTLKSKMVQESIKPEPVIQDFYVCDVGLKEFSSFDDDQKTKSQGSEETEYLHYTELDQPENESVERPTPETKEPEDNPPSLPVEKDIDESSETLSLTKIGYKMYDNLTKLSLNREKEMTEKAEVKGCGCNGNKMKKSSYNITLESNNSVVKVEVPENELNFQFVNPEGGDIQIGVMSGGDEKKTVRKDELWHTDSSRRALVLRSTDENPGNNSSSSSSTGFQKLKVSLPDNQEVVFMVERNEKERKKEEKTNEKSTKEMKVGTDDFDLAGGDFVCAFDGNHRNLSPRLGQLLKHLNEKLEIGEKERKFLDEKINQKIIDQKFHPGVLPGVFLVKHITPRPPPVKKPGEIPYRKPRKETETQPGSLREYYCEECLATMRIFEDENPSVKSMVDKFETIIQLESY